MGDGPVRLGIIGCATVADYAILDSTRENDAVSVVAVASRDPDRAASWAAERGIPNSYGSYEALLAAGGMDAIYVPLPNAMHREWAVQALRAGYAVLCEKPIAANAAEAIEMAAVSIETGCPLVEAFHWRYHPIAHRMMEIVTSGVLGELRSVAVEFLMPAAMIPTENIRYEFGLGGGAVMDAGCYCINLIRLVLGEPTDIVSARATLVAPQVDGAMKAEMRHRGGEVSEFHCSMIHSGSDFVVNARITGARGSLLVEEPFMPHWGNYLELNVDGGITREVMTTRTTYDFQLAEFAEVVRGRAEIRTPVSDGIANMQVIDQVYRKAGLRPRGTR